MKATTVPSRSFALATVPLLLLACLTACGSTRQLVSDVDRVGVALGESTSEDGTSIEWRLYAGDMGSPRLERTQSKVEMKPRVGVRVAQVTRPRAESLGIEPWKGVLVEGVEAQSSAARAGIVVGDVILGVEGKAVSSPEQFLDVLGLEAAIGEPLDLELRLSRRAGEEIGGAASMVVSVTPEGREAQKSSIDSFELETSPGIRHYTGLELAEIPPSLARLIFDDDRSILLVANVRSGSPAYASGLRGGDVILECDGVPVTSILELRQSALALIQKERFSGPLFDLAALQTEDVGKENQASTMSLKVRGPIGPHTAQLGVDDDLEDAVNFKMPILLHYASDANSADVGFLNFIFQFGFNYKSATRPSATREPVETWELSMLPLGLFQMRRDLDDTHYRLLWFIRW